jgi:hypothetical protein
MTRECDDARTRRAARAIALALLTGVLAAGCGGGDEEGGEAAGKTAKDASADVAAAPKKDAATGASVKLTDANGSRMANAVADSKTTAPIDLLYDIPTKPEVGQPFTVELSVKPRLPADTLDVEIGDSPGITIEGDRAARFPDVQAGEPYTFKVQVRGDAPGLYYISVMAKMATKVQSEGRAFSVPVVIGSPVAAQKPAPQKDASGQAIESMPAKEQ